jgi:Cell division protein CrgA
MPRSKSKRSRYTPPPPKKAPSSPLWVPAAMFTMLITGVVVIVANYLQLLPGGEAENRYLFVGLGLFTGGAILSTQFR